MNRNLFSWLFLIVLFSSSFLSSFTSGVSDIYLGYGQPLVIKDINLVVSGKISGAGHNSITIINSTVTVQSIRLSGGNGYKATIINSTVKGLSGAIVLNSYVMDVRGFTITGETSDTTLLVLRGIKNSVFDGFTYIFTRSYTSTNAVAVSIEGCTNLVFKNVRGIGIKNVRTPHFHLSFAGPSPSTVTVEDSYFYGGGNGITTSNVTYKNCVFDSITDGTEVQKTGTAVAVNCVWKNIHDSEINLQGGAQFKFVNCTFGKGLINAANGHAEFINCKSPAWIWAELKDNDNLHKWLGSAVINGVEYSWIKIGDGYATKIK